MLLSPKHLQRSLLQSPLKRQLFKRRLFCINKFYIFNVFHFAKLKKKWVFFLNINFSRFDSWGGVTPVNNVAWRKCCATFPVLNLETLPVVVRSFLGCVVGARQQATSVACQLAWAYVGDRQPNRYALACRCSRNHLSYTIAKQSRLFLHLQCTSGNNSWMHTNKEQGITWKAKQTNCAPHITI